MPLRRSAGFADADRLVKGEEALRHRLRRIRAARECGWKVAQQQACFLFSPYVYRRLPLAVVRGLARVEARVPARRRARVFWRLERTG